MKKLHYYLATSTVAFALMAAAPLIASAHSGLDNSSKGVTNIKADTEAHVGIGINLDANIQHILYGTPVPAHATSTPTNGPIATTAVVTAVNGSTLTVHAKGGTTYTVDAANAKLSLNDDNTLSLNEIQIGDTVHVKGTLDGSIITASAVADEAVEVRSVLSANGAAGAGVVTSINGSTFTIKPFGTKATTTVETNASTVYRVNGDLASSSALTVGSKVVLAGTNNTDASIGATIVGIFTAGFGFFKHLLFR